MSRASERLSRISTPGITPMLYPLAGCVGLSPGLFRRRLEGEELAARVQAGEAAPELEVGPHGGVPAAQHPRREEVGLLEAPLQLVLVGLLHHEGAEADPDPEPPLVADAGLKMLKSPMMGFFSTSLKSPPVLPVPSAAVSPQRGCRGCGSSRSCAPATPAPSTRTAHAAMRRAKAVLKPAPWRETLSSWRGLDPWDQGLIPHPGLGANNLRRDDPALAARAALPLPGSRGAALRRLRVARRRGLEPDRGHPGPGRLDGGGVQTDVAEATRRAGAEGSGGRSRPRGDRRPRSGRGGPGPGRHGHPPPPPAEARVPRRGRRGRGPGDRTPSCRRGSTGTRRSSASRPRRPSARST